MIKVVLDPYQLEIEGLEKAELVTQVSDYAKTLLKIRSCLHAESKLTIHVTNHAVCRWLQNYLHGYKQVIVSEYTPEEVLKQRLRVSALPPDLDSQAITSLHLLEKDMPLCDTDDVKGFILGQCVASCWGTVSPSWEHFGDIVTWSLEHSTNDKLGNPLDAWMQERQEQWSNLAIGEFRYTYKWLFNKPYERAKLVAILKMISTYPPDAQLELISDLEESTLPTYVQINKLPIINIPDILVNTLNAKTKIYWNKRLEDCPPITEVLSEMSGRLLGEIESLFLFLEQNISRCDQSTISRLQKHFVSLPEAKDLIDKLDAMLPRSTIPTAPDPEGTWNWREWFEWATKVYLPFRAETQNINIQNNLIDDYEEHYEEWLYNNYPAIIFDQETPLVHATAKRIQEVIDDDFIVLWVIIDNLSWQSAMIFTQFMEEEKLFTIRSPEPRLSLLPSVTTISKSGLVAGQLPCDIPKGIDYEKMLLNRWGKEGVALARNVFDLTRLVAYDSRLYVYMFDDLDELAHGGFVNRDDLIQHNLRQLAFKIGSATSSLAKKGKVRVIISSDHGSVNLPDMAYKAARPEYSELDEKHARFAKVQDTKGLDPGQWHLLQAEVFKLRESYAIAKGYTYIEKRPCALTHGGLTPEETIVAHLEFGLEKPSWMLLTLLYRGPRLDLGREQKIELTLQNPNKLLLTEARIQIPLLHLETEKVRVPPEDQVTIPEFTITLPHKIPIEDDETVRLETLIVFKDVSGNTKSQEFLLKLPVNRLWEPPEGKLFEEMT